MIGNMREITGLLSKARAGEQDAEQLLIERIYSELHVLAAVSSQPNGPTIHSRLQLS